LHVHVQSNEILGSPTHPFHLSAVLYQAQNQRESLFTLFARPQRVKKSLLPKLMPHCCAV